MPIEIRELVIKATIGDSAAASGKEESHSSSGGDSLSEERIIKKVVEKVMELIKMGNNR
ncbi:MAG: DUF5908 family protein [Bacteroidota bacterium]